MSLAFLLRYVASRARSRSGTRDEAHFQVGQVGSVPLRDKIVIRIHSQVGKLFTVESAAGVDAGLGQASRMFVP